MPSRKCLTIRRASQLCDANSAHRFRTLQREDLAIRRRLCEIDRFRTRSHLAFRSGGGASPVPLCAPGLSRLVKTSLRFHLDPVKRGFPCETRGYQESWVRSRTFGDLRSTKLEGNDLVSGRRLSATQGETRRALRRRPGHASLAHAFLLSVSEPAGVWRVHPRQRSLE